MDVGGWLRGLGLGQYEEQFRDNKIDADLLPRLTVDDLKDIGVSVVGDRRRLLDAIAVIAGADPPAAPPASPTKSAPSKGLEASAERRPITVMFCDLVGSTSLAAKLDAEDWRNLVNGYLDQASAAVTDFGGHVLKKLGDGLMALFGYPQAQENDAERAVRAALAIQRALFDLNARNAAKGAPELSARIGIEFRAVVVDASGEVFGDAPNIAARVQAEAEPGSVLITLNRPATGGGAFRRRGARHARTQGRGSACPALSHRSRQRRRPKGWREDANAVCRPRGGARSSNAAAGSARARAKANSCWSSASPASASRGSSRSSTRSLAETPHTWSEWCVVAAIAKHAAASNRRMGPAAFWRGCASRATPRRPRKHVASDRPRPDRICAPARTARRHPAAAGPGHESPAGGAAATATGGNDRLGSGGRADASRRARLRGLCTGPTRRRSTSYVRFADRGAQAPLLVVGYDPSGVPCALERALAPQRDLSVPARSRRVARMVGEISARHALSKGARRGG